MSDKNIPLKSTLLKCPYGKPHEPNQETIDTMEKSDRGEDLHRFNSVDELFEDLFDES